MFGRKLMTGGLAVNFLIAVPAATAEPAARHGEPADRNAATSLHPGGQIAGLQSGEFIQEPDSFDQKKLRRALAELQARLRAEQARHEAALQIARKLIQGKMAGLRQAFSHAQERALQKQTTKLRENLARFEALQEAAPIQVFAESGGWLGVTITEVTPEKVQELRLPAERGVLITSVADDSPASKARLQVNDVITEYNGQRVEGTVQFRRMIRETPPDRTVQLTVWRDGRAQPVSVKLGSRTDQIRSQVRIFEPYFEFGAVPEGGIFAAIDPWRTLTLGIVGEDLTGQLGEYFGAPDGQGVLVREVRKGTPAEKAGLKAGDVIVRVDGERVHSLSELRNALRQKREENSVRLDVLRRGQELSVDVAVEPPPSHHRTRPGRRVVL